MPIWVFVLLHVSHFYERLFGDGETDFCPQLLKFQTMVCCLHSFGQNIVVEGPCSGRAAHLLMGRKQRDKLQSLVTCRSLVRPCPPKGSPISQQHHTRNQAFNTQAFGVHSKLKSQQSSCIEANGRFRAWDGRHGSVKLLDKRGFDVVRIF